MDPNFVCLQASISGMQFLACVCYMPRWLSTLHVMVVPKHVCLLHVMVVASHA